MLYCGAMDRKGQPMFRTLITSTLVAAICASLTLARPASLSAQTTESADSLSSSKADRQNRQAYREKRRAAMLSRPAYSERQLREENLNDIEIRQIEQATRAIVPGAIVNIGGVWDACPCEDGDQCTNQVWVVISVPGKSTGVMLSKISDRWDIGPVQEWWFDYEDHEGKVRDLNLRRQRADYTQMLALNEERRLLSEEKILLIQRFPFCATEEPDPSIK